MIRLARWRGGAEAAGEGAWLALGLTVVIGPYVVRDAPWLGGVWLLLVLWFFHSLWRGTFPRRRILLPATVGAVVLVVAIHRTLAGVDAGLALLVMMTGLKLQEARTVRDRLLVVYLGFFVVGGQFLIYEDLPTALYLAGGVLALAGAWLRVAAGPGVLTVRGVARRTAALSALAIPVAVILFLAFPRGIGPFWGVPDPGGDQGVTGISDQMDPGSISSLAESDAIAFRAWFEDEVPPERERYWRGPVLWEGDGLSWERGSRVAASEPVRPLPAETVSHTILMEPAGHRWIAAFDRPVTSSGDARLSPDGVLSTPDPLQERERFELVSAIPEERVLDDRAGAARGLPEGGNPRARELAQELRESAQNDEDVLRGLAERLQGEAFRYTLNPPSHDGPDSVDRFLFETRTGFCEHYAGSAAFVLRAAGLPARVVIGYQGGELNPMGEYLLVRQSDAHAWVEVYVDGAWRRFDPTAVASPERIEGGLEESGDAETDLVVENVVIRRLRMTWDALNTAWHQWILTYDQSSQLAILDRVGLPDLKRWHLGTAGVALVVVWLVVAARLARRRRGKGDPAEAAYARFLRRMARVGMAARIGEGPWAFAERAIQARPDEGEAIRRITEDYVAWRYGGRQGDPALRRRLVARVRWFRPRKVSRSGPGAPGTHGQAG